MRLLRHDPHSLSGAYALDALELGAEHDRFTRHLSRCPSCASEVRGFREVATAMAFAATAEPPAGLRDQVLAAAARTRQLLDDPAELDRILAAGAAQARAVAGPTLDEAYRRVGFLPAAQ